MSIRNLVQLSLDLSSFFCEASLNWIHFMLGLSQFHGWVGQDLSRAMQSIETVEKSEREREGKQLKDQEKERPNWRILCFVKGRKVWGKQGTCFL